MITRLKLRNLKCFEKLDIRLAPLTLLTGLNAAGKSTTLQALLLLAQTLRAHTKNGELLLNGQLVSLGSPGEVLNENSPGNGLSLGFDAGREEYLWNFALHEENAKRYLQAISFNQKPFNAQPLPRREMIGLFPRVLDGHFEERCKPVRDLTFLAANRKTNRDLFPTADPFLAEGDPGCVGQFAPWQMHSFGDSQVDPARCVHGSTSGTIRKALNEWLSRIFPGSEVNVSSINRTDLLKLEFRTSVAGEWKRPSNVGFGLSYAFPMLAAGLCSPAGRTLIIDSPEAHLHPKAQSVCGEFISRLAAAGQQLVCETHSDHLINGVRLAVKNGVLRPEQVVIYFFQPKEPRVSELSIDQAGNVSAWPEGFFDQAETDLAELAGWS